jgi:outer membrane immunogenic protein
MKKLALAVSILVISAVSASAADMAPAPVYTKAPPMEVTPPCVWCGWYVGGNVGYAHSESTSVNSSAVVTNPGFLGTVSPGIPAGAAAALTTGIPVGSGNGVIGGGQFGYSFQSGRFVAGFEADIQGLSGGATGTSVTSVPGSSTTLPLNATLTATNSVNWLGTVRARIGIAVVPNFLIYGTGGLAYGGVNSSTSIKEAFSGADAAAIGINGTFPASGNLSETRVGWTVGAGGEWMFTSNWSAKLEYLHYDLGSANYGTPVNNFTTGGGVFGAGILLSTLGQSSSTNFRGDIVRVGLNYKFGGPAVAKY